MMNKIYTVEEVKAMTNVERYRIMAEVKPVFVEEDEFDYEATCETCPFRKVCGEMNLFFGCWHWEEMMGEDL